MQCWSLYNVQHTMEGEERKRGSEGLRKEVRNEYKKENI